MKVSFTLPITPRTKKTSNRVVSIRQKGTGRSFTKILPSEAFEEFFAEAMTYAPVIKQRLSAAGVSLPIIGPVSVNAQFYRDADTGDLLGYEQALGDWLQSPRVSKRNPTKLTRNGAGIIEDDVQIESWDGSRRQIDRARPRIEVIIEAQECLFDQVRKPSC